MRWPVLTAGAAVCAAALALIAPATVSGRQAPTAADVATRVTERLAALRREAEALSKQEQTILTELRTLELERQIKQHELTAVQAELAATGERVVQARVRAAALERTASDRAPDVEERLVRLYKMGRAGHWRLLLDVDDLQAMGRAYRTAAALTRLDRERVQAHQSTLEGIRRELAELDTRTQELAALEARAAGARRALDQAVATRAALVQSIDSRRDVAMQLAAELDAAHLKLQATLAQRPGAPATVTVPFRPFRGALPWPAQGIVTGRFGRDRAARVPGIEFNRNGIELSLAEGQPVAAIHEGTVTHAGPFSGLGLLVIVDHGSGVGSLYGHLATVSVNTGERVGAGTNVGTSGRNAVGNPSLYFELRVDGQPVDPLQWLRRP
jgi:septal ring factor EnvC (AmiA/AmiB activator)